MAKHLLSLAVSFAGVHVTLQTNVLSIDQKLISEFYDSSIGIAFTMIEKECWQNPGTCKGNNGMDRAVFFADPPSSFQLNAQQAMTLVHNGLSPAPYLGSGGYGVALHIDQNHNFWQYFQKNEREEICGLPHDGFKCAGRYPVVNESYSWFEAQKNNIFSQYHGFYNEFDVNGLSSSALAGVIYWDHYDWMGYTYPNATWQSIMCNFLEYANAGRNSAWPIYKYYFNSLALVGYLDCGTGPAPPIPPAPTPSPAPASSCSVADSQKTDCGYFGITESQCIAKGCCWEASPGFPYCFNKGSARGSVLV